MTLSTPVLWVLFPLAMAALIGVFYQRQVLGIILTCLTAFGLSILAIFFPEDLLITIGSFEIVFTESIGFFGRQITVAVSMLPFISLIYAAAGLWAIISSLPNTPASFRPLSLAITALLTAVMGVEPFLYAALLIQTAVLASIPMLSPFSTVGEKGILRYLTLETFALPLILLAGWMLSGVETLPQDSALVGQTAVVLGLGFALWLGVFPFHSWIPMVGQSTRPNVFTFLMFIIPTTILVFSLNFLNRYTFLRTLPDLDDALRLFGTLMIVIGGFWTAFQEDLRRAFSFSVLTEIGFSLLAVSQFEQGGLTWMLMHFPVRALGFWLWGFTLTALDNYTGSLDRHSLQGIAHQYPILSAGILLSQLSIAGLPLLASFPIKSVLFNTTFIASPSQGVWSFVGNLGLFLFTLRLLASFVRSEIDSQPQNWSLHEKRYEILLVGAAILLLIAFGLFPNTILAPITETLTAFAQLQ